MSNSAQEAIETISRSSVLLDATIRPAKLYQNTNKAEHVATFMGVGQDSHTKEFYQGLKANNMGELKKAARYLSLIHI